jgi:hypothetical protein
MSQQNSSVNSRLVFENAASIMQGAGLNLNDAILTQSDLVLEQLLAVGLTSYTFPVLQNDISPNGAQRFNTEIRLTQQDSFVASSCGMFLIRAATPVDATLIAHTYPSPAVFSGAGVAAALETLYNSYMKIVVNNQVIVPVWHLSRHRMVPQSQQVAAGANQNGIAQDQIDLSSDGFFPMEPNVIIIGSKGTVITITLPQALAAVDGTGTPSDRVRLHFRGVLGQNTTIIT